MKKYYAYIRKSTDEKDKQTLSLAAQERIIKEFAERNNFQIVKWFTESKSAKQPGRQKFNEMLNETRLNKNIDGILAHKVDRLTRNDFDQALLIELTTQKKEIQTVDNSSFGPDSPTSALNFRIQGAFASYYIENLRQEVKKGMKQKIIDGWFPALAPYGYENFKDTDGKSKIRINEDISPHIKKIFEMIAYKNYSLREVARYLNSIGLVSKKTKKPITKGTIWQIVKNEFYYGMFRWDGELHQGRHTPLVDFETWRRANSILGRKEFGKQEKHYFPYRGYIHCGCGKKITAETKKGHIYYRCTKSDGADKCHEKYLLKSGLEEQFLEVFKKFRIKKDLAELIKNDLIESHEQETKYRDAAIRSIDTRIAVSTQKLDGLLDLLIDRSISKNVYEEKKRTIEEERENCNIELKSHQRADERWRDEVENFFELINSGYETFKIANERERDLMVRKISSNLVIKDKKLVPELKLAFQIVSQNVNRTNWWRKGFLVLRQ